MGTLHSYSQNKHLGTYPAVGACLGHYSTYNFIDTTPGSIRDIGDCKKVFKEDFSIEASDQDCEVVRRVCEAVSTRAARLAASGIVALVKKINKIDGCSVAVDGSLYKLHPKFPERYYNIRI